LIKLLSQIGFTPQQTVLHVHNHALGKNVSWPGCLKRLSTAGYPLLLQIHDFPEDFRPANYRRLRGALAVRRGAAAAPTARSSHGRPAAELDLAAELYPQAPHIHYAVLNGRDERILGAAGVSAGRLHALPNPVPEMDHLPPVSEARRLLAEKFGIAEHQRLLLYPVRCIRRKNVGEALLYAALMAPEMMVGLTLPPLNPAEVAGYQSWKQLAAELRLPCRFELGVPGALSLAENLAAADLICTTSLAEGFGMVFLESWLAGRPLVGRDLPEITRDFTELGIRLDWLCPQLRVPVEWIGIDTFRRTILEAYRRTLEAYGREEPEDLPGLLHARTEDGLVDFADLGATLQRQVLRIVSGSRENRRCVLRCNGWIEPALSIARDGVSGVIEANVRAVRQHFSLAASGRRLLDVYRQVAASPRSDRPEPLPNGDRIAREFLDFRRFRPIRE
jgi:glycosyltransferase involved in cell wall biosynthesis